MINLKKQIKKKELLYLYIVDECEIKTKTFANGMN